MKKSIFLTFFITVLIFSSIVMVISKKEANKDDKSNINREKNENIELGKSQENEEDESIKIEESQLKLEESLMRYDSQNGIDMAVIFNNLLEDDKDYIVFKVMANNHSIDLGDIKYAELSQLKINEDTVINEGFQWELEGGNGHHISGYLKLPKTYNGKSVINDKATNIQLEIEGVGNAENLTFKWSKEVIDSYNKGGM